MSNERSLSVAEIWRLALVDPTHHGECVIGEVFAELESLAGRPVETRVCDRPEPADLALVDTTVVDLTGDMVTPVELLLDTVTARPHVPVLAVVPEDDPDLASRAMVAGAQAVIKMGEDAEVFGQELLTPVRDLDAVTEGMSSWDRGSEDVELVIEPSQMVHAIGSHVWSVLRELLDNAFLHGRAPVILAAHSRGDSTVIDHGEGIGEEVKERLQLGFAQRSETGDQHTQGTGLWLARALVKAYGGSLHHQSVLGGGTRFVCAFPSRAVGLDA
ncbi:MAG: ATP-binding protein [Actinomycetota bacterium]|nr:ATP-binding protein [Actinomycetota bacterium]